MENSNFKFVKKVDLSKLGEEYKGITLEFKKPSLFQLQAMNNSENLHQLLSDLYVSGAESKEDFIANYNTWDVQSFCGLELGSNDFLAQKMKELQEKSKP